MAFGVIERGDESANVVEAELDPELGEAEQPVQGVLIHYPCAAGSATGETAGGVSGFGAGAAPMKRSALAIVAFISRRSTTRSSIPFSIRNSERWKPSGSFWRMVCSMTRGPANPISAFGSAMFRSPSIAKLAVTPPVVGSVSTEMYGRRALSSRASADETLAICISDRAPSIIR